jgi:hypothetical protein
MLVALVGGVLVAAMVGLLTLILLGNITRNKAQHTQNENEVQLQQYNNPKERRWRKFLEQAQRFEQEEDDEDEEEEKKKKKEEGEYNKWKKDLSVEEEGVVTQVDLLKVVERVIGENKYIRIEELAARIGVSVQVCAQAIEKLVKERVVCGILEERGTFLRLEPEELEQLTKFVQDKGRFTLAEFSAEVNRVVKL